MAAFSEIRQLYGLTDLENHGYSEAEILAFELKNGLRLPGVLRAYYLALGRHEGINASFNRLLALENEVGFSDNRHLVFYEENQGVAIWGIRETDVQFDNPPVYACYDAGSPTEIWVADSPTTTDFLLAMAILNGTLGGLAYNANCLNEKQVGAGTLALIENNWTEIKGITYQAQRFFTDNFAEVISMSIDEQNLPSGLFIGTNDKSRFNRLINRLAIAWDYRSDEDEE